MNRYEKMSFAIATGTIASRITVSDGMASFSLRTAEANLHVKLPQPLLPRLQKHDHISVVGHLSSFHNRCGSQAFISAAVILTGSYARLWDDIGVPALLRTILLLETPPEAHP